MAVCQDELSEFGSALSLGDFNNFLALCSPLWFLSFHGTGQRRGRDYCNFFQPAPMLCFCVWTTEESICVVFLLVIPWQGCDDFVVVRYFHRKCKKCHRRQTFCWNSVKNAGISKMQFTLSDAPVPKRRAKMTSLQRTNNSAVLMSRNIPFIWLNRMVVCAKVNREIQFTVKAYPPPMGRNHLNSGTVTIGGTKTRSIYPAPTKWGDLD